MQERLVQRNSTGLNTTGLRAWGMVILVLATAGKALLQNRLLNLNGNTDLLTALSSSEGMIIATVAIVLQAVESCAAPIFCFLLVEGALHTADFVKYMVRVICLALIAEVPYNFAMSAKLFDLSSRNPAFAMALGLVLLYFFRRYEGKGVKNMAVKVLLTFAAFLWASMLNIVHGQACVGLVAVLWAFRGKPNYRNIAGCCAAVVCSLLSPFYLSAPMGFMVVHFYNGEKGPSGRVYNYLAYPVALLAIGLIGMFLM